MSKLNWSGLAFLAAATASITFLTASFLPFFMHEVWGPLWGVEWWPPGTVRAFGRVDPLCGFSPRAEQVAVPLSAALVVGWFTVVVAILVLRWSQVGPQRR